LQEGNIYGPIELRDIGVHLLLQQSISGNATVGANAMIIAREQADRLDEDTFTKLMHPYDSKNGAQGMSYKKQIVIPFF
jgi:hypothetical protein